MYRARSVIGSHPVCRILIRNGSWFNRSEPSRMDKFLAKKRRWLPMSGKKYTSSPAPEESTVPKFEQEDKFHNRPTGYTIANKFEGAVPMGASINNQLLRPPEQRIRPSSSSKYQEAEENVPDLPGYVAPMPTETHLSFHSEMCRDLDNLGDRWKYPQEWEDYMDFAVENDVGLTPDNPHIIFAESSKAIASCICDPEMPFVNYHFITENNGEPMACECGYFFKLERVPVAPPMHKLMEIPDGGHFDPRRYNPDDNSYTESYADKEDRINRFTFLKEGPKGSGLNRLEEAEIKQGIFEAMRNDPAETKYVLDYRQKPDGYLNYTNTEVKPGEKEGMWTSILIPEDDEEELMRIQEDAEKRYQIRAAKIEERLLLEAEELGLLEKGQDETNSKYQVKLPSAPTNDNIDSEQT